MSHLFGWIYFLLMCSFSISSFLAKSFGFRTCFIKCNSLTPYYGSLYCASAKEIAFAPLLNLHHYFLHSHISKDKQDKFHSQNYPRLISSVMMTIRTGVIHSNSKKVNILSVHGNARCILTLLSQRFALFVVMG